MDKPGKDCGQVCIEFHDLKLVLGEKLAREVCQEYEGRALPEAPPDPRIERNKLIRKLYFKDGLKQDDIANRVGLSRVWVNHIIGRND